MTFELILKCMLSQLLILLRIDYRPQQVYPSVCWEVNLSRVEFN